MQGIPTIYAGRQMRSLLEAKWAAFFDEIGWRWEYEPREFNGWIPDFVLFGAKQQTFVEVKPIMACDYAVCAEIDRSGCADEVLLLGLCPDQRSTYYDYPSLGWIREGESKDCCGWQVAHFHGGIRGNLVVGFHAEDGSWHNRITGDWNGDEGSFVCSYDHDVRARITKAWSSSCNRVQWQGRKPKAWTPPTDDERRAAEAWRLEQLRLLRNATRDRDS